MNGEGRRRMVELQFAHCHYDLLVLVLPHGVGRSRTVAAPREQMRAIDVCMRLQNIVSSY